jgi:hypothetical protein
MKCLCDKKKIKLLHKVACRLNIHDHKWVFDPKSKEHGSKQKFKQDIAISAQFEHDRHSTHERGSYRIFTKLYTYQSYQEHNYSSHEHH